MTKNKDYIEAGDYITVKSNADSEIHVKTVQIDGELALISPFSSSVWNYRFDNPTTIQEMNSFFNQLGSTWIEKVEETVEASVHIDEEPCKNVLVTKHVHKDCLITRLKDKVTQLI